MKFSRKYKRKLKKRLLTGLSSITMVTMLLAGSKLAGFSAPIESLRKNVVTLFSSESNVPAMQSGARLQNTATTTYIYDVADLVAFRNDVRAGNNYSGKTIYLMNDLDLSSVCAPGKGSWLPIGYYNSSTDYKAFAGTFDGNNHTISGLYIGSGKYVGLFAYTTYANIKNLSIANSTIIGSYFVGAFTTNGNANLTNCHVRPGVTIEATTTDGYGSYVGGLAAENSGNISRCSNGATVKGASNYVGGIVGVSGGKVSSCYNTGTITGGTANVGGIVGVNFTVSAISDCYNRGAINGVNDSGGILGMVHCNDGTSVSIVRCYSTGAIATAKYRGGIIGDDLNASKITSMATNYWLQGTSLYGRGASKNNTNAASVTAATLKGYASTLGSAYATDVFNINDGYPVLKWQNEPITFESKRENIEIGETTNLRCNKDAVMSNSIYNGYTFNIVWSSLNEDVATVDNNGIVTGVGVGETTITAKVTVSKNGQSYTYYAEAIVSVCHQGAFTTPKVDAGSMFYVALREDGTVWTWGHNADGQLGLGDYSDRSYPTKVPGLENVVDIAAGSYHTLVLKKDGTVWATGYNNCGQLGDGTTGKSNTFKKVSNLNDIIQISTSGFISNGKYSSYALTRSGEVYGWGSNSYGELGQGTTDNSAHSTPLKLKNTENIIQISAGLCKIMMLDSNGVVYGLGFNDAGVFGIGDMTNQSLPIKMPDENGGSLIGVQRVASGIWHTIIIKNNKTVWGAGFNYFGSLGDSTNTKRYTIVQMKDENGTAITNARNIVAGAETTYVLTNQDGMYVTGWNDQGQLFTGNKNNLNYAKRVLVDKKIISMTPSIYYYYYSETNRVSYASGAIIDENGDVYSVGYNGKGQLGNGTTTNSTELVRVLKQEETKFNIDNRTIIKADDVPFDIDLVSCAGQFNVFGEGTPNQSEWKWSSLDETVATVNENTGEVVGVGPGETTITAYNEKVDVYAQIVIKVRRDVPGAITNPKVASGNFHFVALKEDGTVWTWGCNTDGQLGLGDKTNRSYPTKVEELSDIVDVACGPYHTLALTANGEVWATGYNNFGQLGNGTNTLSTKFVKVNNLTNIVQIAAGGYSNTNQQHNSYALANDGTIYAWGNNTYGQLVQGTTDTNVHSTPLVAKISKNMIKIGSTGPRLVTLSINGDVYGIGHNSDGEFGTGNTSNYSSLVKISDATGGNLTGVKDVSAGLWHIIIIRDYGEDKNTLWATGWNKYGSLGKGDYAEKITRIVQMKDTSGNPIKNARKIYAGSETSYILADQNNTNDTNGMYVTGWNTYGQLFTGVAGNLNKATKVLDDKNILLMDATNHYDTSQVSYGAGLIADVEGFVYTVGYNVHSQLGNGLTTSSLTPVKTGAYLNYRKDEITVTSTGSYTINTNDFKLERFNVFVGGDNSENAGTLSYESMDTSIATVNGSGVVSGVAEGYTKIKVTDTTNNVSTYVTVKVINIQGEQLALGEKFSVGLTTSGQVWTWGSNFYGELGINSEEEYKDKPQKVESLNNVKSIGAGSYHAVALINDGSVYTWGLNNEGQLGTGNTENSKVPVKVEGLENIVKVDAYKYTTTALDSEGNVYIWGQGYGNTPVKLENIKAIDVQDNVIINKERRIQRLDGTCVYDLVNPVKVSANEDRILAVKDDGTVYTIDNTNKVTALSVTNAVDVSSGNGYGIILTANGDVYTFGKNDTYQLANGNANLVTNPTKITTLNAITEIIAASEGGHTAIADREGNIYTCGLNDKGQLGHGNIDTIPNLKLLLNVAVEKNVDKVIESVGESKDVEIGLGITLNLKKDLQENTTTNISIVDSNIAELIEISNGKYRVTGKKIGRTFLNATISGNINGEERQFGSNIEVRIVPEGGITIPKIVSGKEFTVALKADGTIWTWGNNQYGQLGLGNYENCDEPQKIEDIEETIVEIVAGNNHVLALGESGKIYAWGFNNCGQIGNGTVANQVSSASVINVYGNELSKIIRVEAHGDNSFAINQDGKVFAWGKDYGTKAKELDYMENVIDVSTSYFVKANGEVWTNAKEPQKIPTVDHVTKMDEGTNHTVFLSSEGTAYAIGNNTFGQLGNGTNDHSPNGAVAIRKAKETGGSEIFTNIVDILAGDRFTVLVEDNQNNSNEKSKVYICGLNENGLIGIDDTTVTGKNLPVLMSNIDDIMLVSAGSNHIVAAKNNGEVYAWGTGAKGQLGNRMTKNSTTPVMVGEYIVRADENHVVIGKTDSKNVKAKVEYFNMVKTDEIGINAVSKNTQVATVTKEADGTFTIYGQGIGTTNIVLTEEKTNTVGIINVEVLPEKGITISPDVQTTGNHTVTLKTNGEVWTYGQNKYGQLGIGTLNTEDEPKKVTFEEGTIIKQIAVGENHSVALDTEGNVWTWGRNNYYQLGVAGIEYSLAPVKVANLPKVKRISAGINSVMVVTENNKLYAWGQNAYGELGTGEYTNKQLPIKVEGMHDVLDIGGGKSHYIILKTTGEMYAVGSNLYGQLGIDLGERTRTNTFEKINVTQKMGSISTAWSSNMAVTLEGRVFVWGQNTYGELGTGNKDNKYTPVMLDGMKNIVQASLGKVHSILRDVNGEIYLTGTNLQGQFGNRTTNNSYTYIKNTEIEDILRISAGNTYTVVMKNDGFVWAWGDYNNGDRDKKSSTKSKVPVLIGSDTSSLQNTEITVKISEVKSLIANSTFRFNLIYEDKNESSKFTYESLNTGIVKVNQNGDILGVKTGTTWVKMTDIKTGKESIAIVRVIDNVEGYSTYVAPKIATGENFEVSLKEKGRMDIWGYDDSRIIDSRIPNNINVVDSYIDAVVGKNFLVVLRKDGTVWTAGANNYGQLGIGNNISQNKLVQIPNLTDIEKIACGDNFGVAIDKFGLTYVWGEGFGNTPEMLDTNIRKVTSLSAGSKDQIVFILPTNEVYGIGSILNGTIPNLDNAVKVEVGEDYLLILNTKGEIYKYKGGILSKIATGTNKAVDISVCHNTNMYQSLDEKVFIWGTNTSGQAGVNGTSDNILVPTRPIEHGTNVFRIAAGYDNTYIIDNDGLVYASGANNYGQIGNGTKQNALTHTLVGDRSFEVKPENQILEINDREELQITSSTYNVFREQGNKAITEYDITSNDDTIVEIETNENVITGWIKALAEGKTTVDITDKVTGDTVTITRKVVPMKQDRLEEILANGEKAEGLEPGEEDTYISKFEVNVPLDDGEQQITLDITTLEKFATDKIKISLDNEETWIPVEDIQGHLTTTVTIGENEEELTIPIKLIATNGTEFGYDLTINRISNNNNIEKVTVNGYEASLTGENTYEIIVTDKGTNKVVVTPEKEVSSVTIKGIDQNEYDLDLSKGYVELPIKVTSESGRAKNSVLKVYTPEERLRLLSVKFNNEEIKPEDDGTYKKIIPDNMSGGSLTVTTKYEEVKVGINNSIKNINTIVKNINTLADHTEVTIQVEADLIFDGNTMPEKVTNEYVLNIYKNRVFSKIQTLEIKPENETEYEVLEEENNSYTAYIYSNVNEIEVKITAKEESYTIAFNGENANGTLIKEEQISKNETIYTFTVDGEEYTLKVIRGETDTSIKKITVGKDSYIVEALETEETIDDKKVYEVKILDTYTNVDVTVQTAIKTSKISINNNVTFTPKTVTENMNLDSKTTLVPILIKTADEKTEEEYILRIIRQEDNTKIEQININELLGGADISATLELTNNQEQNRYEVYMQNATPKISIYALTESEFAKVSINGEEAEVKEQTIELDLESSITEIELLVTSEAGTEKIYYLNIYTISDNTNIESVTVDTQGEAVWNSTNKRYEIKVDRNMPTYNVTLISEETDAKVAINIVEDTHEVTTPVSNEIGVTESILTVTAPNGITSKTYPLAIIEKSNNIDVGYVRVKGSSKLDGTDSNITVNSLTQDANGDYYVEVVSKVKSILIEIGAVDGNATIELEGNEQTGVWKGSKTLTSDESEFTFKITAEDGVTKTPDPGHTIYVKRLDGNTNISTFKVNYTKGETNYSKDPEQRPDETYYLKVPRVNDFSTVITLEKATSKINILGNEELGGITYNFSVTGEKLELPIIVTAEDGNKLETKLVIEKESQDATLKKLETPGNPAEKKDDETYVLKVDRHVTNIDLTAIPTNEFAKVRLQGEEEYVSTLDGVNVDITNKNQIVVEVLAEDKETTKTYTIEIVRTFDTSINSVIVKTNNEENTNEVTHQVTLGENVNVIEAETENGKIIITAKETDAEIYLFNDNVSLSDVGTLETTETLLEEEVVTYTIIVKGPDEYNEYEKEYTLKLRRKSTNNNAEILLDQATMTKNQTTGLYEAEVVGEVHTLHANLASEYASSTITIGNKTENIQGSKDVSLQPGETKEITITVTSETGDSKEYNIKLYRKNNNVGVKVEVQDEEEAEKELITKQNGIYYKEVPRKQTQVILTLTATDTKATIKVGALESKDGVLVITKPLDEVINEVKFTVTAEDGTTTPEQTIKIVKVFDTQINEVVVKTNNKENTNEVTHSVTLGNEVNVIESETKDGTIVITAKDQEAIIYLYKGNTQIAKSESTDNGVLIKVEELQEETEVEYTIKVEGPGDYNIFSSESTLKLRRKSTNNNAVIKVNDKVVTKDETSGKYKVSVESENNTLVVEVESTHASLLIDGVNTNTKGVKLDTKETATIKVEVFAETDAKEEYIVEIYRLPSKDATLKKVDSDQDIEKKDDTTYEISVDNRLNKIKFTALPTDSKAKVRIQGEEDYVSSLDGVEIDIEGIASFVVETIAEDEKTTLEYTILIKKVFNTKLSELKVDNEEAVKDGNKYTALVQNVENHNIKIVTENEEAIISIYDSNDTLLKTKTGNISLDDSFDTDSKTYKIVVQGVGDYSETIKEYELVVTKKSKDATATIYVNGTKVAKDEESGKYKVVTKIDTNNLRIETTHAEASIVVNDGAPYKHQFTSNYTVATGSTSTINITVTSQNGESEEYVVEITHLDNNTVVSIITVNDKEATKINNSLYRSAQSKDKTNASVRVVLQDALAKATTKVGDTVYKATGTLEFDVPLSGAGTIKQVITIIAQDGTLRDIELTIVQNASENINVIAKVNNIPATKLDDSTYRIFVDAVASDTVKIELSGEDEYTTIKYGEVEGQVITFNKTLDENTNMLTINFTAISEVGETKDYVLYVMKESTDNTIGSLYVNGMEIQKGEDGRYTAYVENTSGNPVVRVETNNEYAYVRIDKFEEEPRKTQQIVPLGETKTTTVPIIIRSQSGKIKTEYLDLITAYVVGNIEHVIVDNKEVTNYDEKTKTYTALVDGSLSEHKIKVEVDNKFVTLELNDDVGLGSVTTIAQFEEDKLEKELTLYITGETHLTESYTIKLIKNSNDTKLKEVTVNDVTLTVNDRLQYHKYIDKVATTAKIKVTAAYPYAKIKIGNSDVAIGQTSEVWVDLKLKQDEITIPVVVTAADGETIDTYNIILSRVGAMIVGNVITENWEGKHIATVTVYRTDDTREIGDELDPREVITNVQTNEDGTYSLEVPMVDTYDIVITKPGYLSTTITNIVPVLTDSVVVQEVKLIAGDVVLSNEIEISDLVYMNDNIHKTKDMKCDLNEDGVVDDKDRDILERNYGQLAQSKMWNKPVMATYSMKKSYEVQPKFVLPMKEGYEITSSYGKREAPTAGASTYHRGIDISGDWHTPIMSIADGQVTFAGVQDGYGNCVEIKHIVDGETIYSFYAHLSQIDVSKGQEVKQGEQIGLEGGAITDPNHGSSTGHHLHFEIRKTSLSKDTVDPTEYINFKLYSIDG